MRKILMVFIGVVVLGSVSFGASFGAFGGISEGVSLAPTFYIPLDPFGVGVDLICAFGVMPKVDLQVNFSSLWFVDGNFAWNGVWIMPRYDLGGFSILNFNVLALKLSYTGALELGVEYHTELGLLKDLLSLEFNAGLGIIPDLNLYFIIAPVIYLSKLVGLPVGVYFEVDVGSDLSSFGTGYILGVTFSKGNLSFNVGYDFSQKVVGWVSISF